MVSPEQNNNVKIAKTQAIDAAPYTVDANLVQVLGQVDSALMMMGMLAETRVLVRTEPNNINEDYEWYASGQLDTSSFKGQYIAIWRKQVVGSGETPLEAERLAKARFGEECTPALVYVPEDSDSIL